MEIIIGLVIVVGVLAYLTLRKQPETSTPAPTIVPGGEPISTLVVEGAGQVDIPKSNIDQRLWEQSMANLEKEKAAESAKVEQIKAEEPAKKPRKPRAPKAEKPAAKKTVAKKVATKKTTKKA